MPRDRDFLLDILDQAALAIDHLAGKSEDELAADEQLQAAIRYRFVVIGEAAGRISQPTQDRFPQLPWRLMKGMRNIVVHEYDSVDVHIVWMTARTDLPPLVAELERLLQEDWPSD
jgi:uncharacterized protein with HEPN domain